MNFNSPIINRLRSNRNYQETNMLKKTVKRKKKSVNEDVEFHEIVDQICTPLAPSTSTSNFEEDFLSGFCFDQEDSYENFIVSDFDKLDLNSDLKTEESWYVSFSKRNGYKLYSYGYCYTAEKQCYMHYCRIKNRLLTKNYFE
ncbi:unnamed protein product [Brachionus calyciflorus]|uniref:Uncharacterized protein n=1 Tax=Brachionus calyciflorus TaxID=104777 RepID=A0A813TRY0_9BILA|nr:unnamed protein product [Brachionus calyciflorus]